MITLHPVRRITIVAESVLEKRIVERCLKLGAKGYTVIECHGAGQHQIVANPLAGGTRVRIETLVQPEVADKILDYLSKQIFPKFAVTAVSETVEVVRADHF